VDNTFQRFDRDPHERVAATTQHPKALAEDAKADAERECIRAAWEKLTLRPKHRLRGIARPPSALGALLRDTAPSAPALALDADPVLSSRGSRR
jgi:hypothetical protein